MKGILKTCTYRKHIFLVCFSLLLHFLSTAQNDIVTENQKTGNPASEWDITGAGDMSIQGFATDISANVGERVHFKIKTNASAYTIKIYRIGYYNGLGARYIADGIVSATLPQVQPDPAEDLVDGTGLTDYGTWNESGHWDVPADAVSGVYIAVIRRSDTNGASHIIFIVRNDGSNSDMIFQTSDATWQAYNSYGGNSLYVGATSYPNGHATKVSYNRPFITRGGGGGGGAMEDWLFNAEYPMIRFLERNGYDVTYTTNVDAARRGHLILNHKIFLSVGHDEYWSAEARAAVENARNSGVHLAFFSGNEVYWKTRWENSIDGNNVSHRTLVCYKEGTVGENTCGSGCDPDTEWTGTWKSNVSGGIGNPENRLTGQIGWELGTSAIQVPAAYKNLRFWRNTSVATLGIEDVKTFPNGTLGYEWDFEQDLYAPYNPPGRIRLSNTLSNGKTHKLSLYRHSSGALVFGAGTVQWSWGLDGVHDRGNLAPDVDMQQATVNLFADMDVQPATLQNNLVAATKSTDVQAPITIITTPLEGATVPVGEPVTIAGTASDNAQVASIEISFDNGSTWRVVPGGNTNWQYVWTPLVQGPVVIKIRGVDDSGNIETAGTAPAANAVNIIVGPPPTPTCPCSVFEPSNAPEVLDLQDNGVGIEKGMKWVSSVDGFVNSIRFYKGPLDDGIHTGTIWTLDGTVLGRVIFTNETASGWQEAPLGIPVPIVAGNVYVVSFHSPTGHYSKTEDFFTGNFINGPLTALGNGVSGPNGVYAYTAEPAFPTDTYQSDNYWVDVVFSTTAGPDVVPPEILTTSPTQSGTNYPVNGTIQINFNEPIDPATVTTSTIELRDANNALITATASYNAGLRRAILTPTSALAYSSHFTVIVKGGGSGVKDLAGNALAVDMNIPFTTVDPPPGSPDAGPGGPILVIKSASNPFSGFAVEMLRAQGMNEFAVLDISVVDATVLSNYDVVILGEVPVTPTQATMFTDWTTAGGTFIAFRPDTDLASLLGITPAAGTLSNQYLLVNTETQEGTGIVNETIQFHGTADLYTLNGATSLATLYSNATTATTNPAVTINAVGPNGGKAIAFTYDLARSIVYTRQGNPAWAGQKRDGQSGPIRSDDLFYGTGGDAHWIDFNKVAIPQADEQQHLLTNIILKSNLHRKPLPRFWFLPNDHKAAIVMTGDDHAQDGTTARFNHYMTLGPNTPQDVLDWKAIRGTSYLFNNTPISNTEVVAFQNKGFEIALHPTTECTNSVQPELGLTIEGQLTDLAEQFPGLYKPTTNRTHCMVWSDWASTAKASAQNGIRLDVNYYYWPGAWIQNRPGMFTGSGMPMRFADLDGSLIDVYQVPTQMTDESEITYSTFVASLLDKANGPEGYYGVFCANMHTDEDVSTGSDIIINAALARQVPVISARQMLNWLDGRNGSSFSNMIWNSNQLNFTVNALINAYKMRGMLPLHAAEGQLATLTRNGSPVTFTIKTVKGIQYGFFDATSGDYVATYEIIPVATISGSVTLQGRPAAPHARWEVPLKVDLYVPGNTGTPDYTYNVVTDQSGNFTINNVPSGTYTIAVKNIHTLKSVRASEVLVGGLNPVNFGTLIEGDVNDNNSVTGVDLSILLNTFGRATGNPGFDARADLNGDGFVSGADLSLILSNFTLFGQNP